MTEIVRDGYDAIADAFAEWRDRIVGDPRRRWREALVERLDDGARVLELGCGRGDDALALSDRFRVTGVDVSEEQLRRARVKASSADFIKADFTELELPAGSFDAVASFYAFNHVPRERLAPLLSRVHDWLVPGGWLLAVFGASDTEAWTGEWLGTTMFFSSFPAHTNTRIVEDAGFAIVHDRVVEIEEPDEKVGFQWMLARSI